MEQKAAHTPIGHAPRTASIRPSNTRTVHGLRGAVTWQNSSSAAEFADHLVDICDAVITGGGMDAPDLMPAGSVKAFRHESGRCIGWCQRHVLRGGRAA